MSSDQRKIFCIGLNKTGTTSFGDALQGLGLRRLGWHGGLSSRLMLRWYEEKPEPFIEAARNYDVMEDLPWPLVYAWMDEAFPEARFVLTVRASPQVWLSSIQAHIDRGKQRSGGYWFGHRMIYGANDPFAAPDQYVARYLEHNAAVRRHFDGRPGKLLELEVGRGNEGQQLGAFLGLSSEIVFPHSNPRPDREPALALSA